MIRTWKESPAQNAHDMTPTALVGLQTLKWVFFPQQTISAVGASHLSTDARNGWRKPPAAGGLCFIEMTAKCDSTWVRTKHPGNLCRGHKFGTGTLQVKKMVGLVREPGGESGRGQRTGSASSRSGR